MKLIKFVKYYQLGVLNPGSLKKHLAVFKLQFFYKIIKPN